MKNKISLISVMLVCCINTPVDAKLTVRKSGYVDAYNQVLQVRQQNQNANQMTASNLPVDVEDSTLAQEIIDNTSATTNMEDLQNCASIYPNGAFKWAVPESGYLQGGDATCVAVVDLIETNSQKVLATTTLAAGDTMICNIDMFPQSGWRPALGNVVLPADNPPTMAEVEKVMDEEQKQNAGLKIAAATILTGIAGNILMPKTAGDDRLVGTNKTQLIGTAVSGAAGGGLMAASVYSGKKTGDMIKSAGLNAASGAVMGNIASGQNGKGSALSIKKCTIEHENSKEEKDCVAGYVYKKTDKDTYKQGNDNILYLINSNESVFKCTGIDVDKCTDYGEENPNNCISDDGEFYKCEPYTHKIFDVVLTNGAKLKDKDDAKNKDSIFSDADCYELQENNKFKADKQDNPVTGEGTTYKYYYLISSATINTSNAERAYAVFNSRIPTKIFGYTDFDDLGTGYELFRRNSDGSLGSQFTGSRDEYRFDPLKLDATDDAIIDFGNAARAKDTMIGAGTGAAMGALSGYQGAKQEIEERWMAATREYADSLSNFACKTGTRFLSQYQPKESQDPIMIPSMPKSKQ